MKKAIKNIGDFDNIIAIRGCQSPGYCEIVCTNQKAVLIGGSIAKVVTLLDSRFVRINRSYLVNQKYIISIDSVGAVIIENGLTISIPRRKR